MWNVWLLNNKCHKQKVSHSLLESLTAYWVGLSLSLSRSLPLPPSPHPLSLPFFVYCLSWLVLPAHQSQSLRQHLWLLVGCQSWHITHTPCAPRWQPEARVQERLRARQESLVSRRLNTLTRRAKSSPKAPKRTRLIKQPEIIAVQLVGWLEYPQFLHLNVDHHLANEMHISQR